SRLWRAHLAVPAKDGRLVLPGIAVPRPEVGDLAHAPRDPAARARVVVRDDRIRALARTKRRVAALPVPRRVESRDTGAYAGGRRDAGAHARTVAEDGRRRGQPRGGAGRSADHGGRGQSHRDDHSPHSKKTTYRQQGYAPRAPDGP